MRNGASNGWWPRSLFGRLALILFVGLAAAHVFTVLLVLAERGMSARKMMISYVAQDVATSVAILERVPAAERAQWLERIARRNYRYLLDPTDNGAEGPAPESAGDLVAAISVALGPGYAVHAGAAGPKRIRLRLHLGDGATLAVDLSPPGMALSPWVPLVLSAQLALLGLFAWLAVRIATRPLAQLAAAADALGPELRGPPLPEAGPTEVARASVAFNAMQRRIADHLDERAQILAAVSHDLQTPITRMRLRAEMLEDGALRQKLESDLDAMQSLVREGIAYARSSHDATEPRCRVDLHALVDSMVCDWSDAGHVLRFLDARANVTAAIVTRPNTLRRVVSNLVDNALAFADEVELLLEDAPNGSVAVVVRDRGPGIPFTELDAVRQPFHRVEGSRNRETGGTGLGLAIADRLAAALGGSLSLSNREDGGLEARFSFPRGEVASTQGR